MAESRIVRIVIDAKDAARGSRKAENAMKRIERQSKRTADTVYQLKQRLGGLAATAAAFVGFDKIARGVDELQNVRNRLRTVTQSQEELNAAWQATLETANRTRSDFGATATLYTRLARATEQFGISQESAMLITERVNKALAAGGAGAAEATSTILQLSQAFQSGRLQGEEFNAIAENAPDILQAVADATGKARSEIKDAASQGEVDIYALVDALTLYGDKIDQKFNQTNATVAQNLTVLGNNLVDVLNKFEQATGVFDKAAKAVGVVANNLDTVGVALGTLAVLYIPRAIVAIKALTIAMMKNPAGAIAVALAGAAAMIYQHWDSVSNFFQRLFYQILPNAFDSGQIALLRFADKFNGAFNKIGEVVSGVVNFVLKGVDAMLGGIERRLNKFVDNINSLTASIDRTVGINLGQLSKLELGSVGRVEFEGVSDEDIQGRVEKLQSRIAERDKMSFASSGGPDAETAQFMRDMEFTTQLVEQAERELTKERKKAERAAKERLEAEAELKGEYKSLRMELDDTFQAEQQFAKAKKTINAALDAQIIKQDEATRMIKLARQAYFDQSEATNELADSFETLKRNLDSTYAAQQRYLEREKLINQAKDEGIIKQKEANRLLKLASEERDQNNKKTDKGITLNKQFGDTIGSSFEEAVFSGQSLRKVVQGLITDLAKLIFRKYVTSQISNIVGGMNFFGLASANGNVFQGGRHVEKYANGGVVNRPTTFPMRDGGMGLMGEAGPESIMPLKRDRKGRLGVIVAGQQGGGGGGSPSVVVAPTINVNAQGGEPEQNRDLASQISKEIVPQMRSLVVNELRQQMRPGGMFNNTTMGGAR